MKIMKKLMAMLMMAGMVFAFPACGSDDDDKKIQDPNEVVTQQGQWTESGDKMTYTHSYGLAGYNYQEKWIFTMKDGVCTGAETQITCPTEELAKMVEQEYKDDPESGVQVSRKGKVITIKYTDEDHAYIGMSKETLKMIFDSMYGDM